MKYDVIGLGPDDLRLSAIYVAQTMANNVQNVKDAANRDVEKNPFTSANVDVLGQLKKNKFKIIQRNGKKIGVTTLLGNEHFAAVKQPRVDLKEAELAGAATGDRSNDCGTMRSKGACRVHVA